MTGAAGLRVAVLPLAVAAGLGLAAAVLREGALLAAFLVDLLLLELAEADLVALRAGAFSAAERLGIGFGRPVDLPASVRFLAADLVEEREAGRAGDRLTPLMTGSLMRSHRLSKGRLENQRTAAKT